MDGWMLKINAGAGPTLREAWFAGRRPGQYFSGIFDLASVQRCYEFSKSTSTAHKFTKASDAFQVLTILKDVGILSAVHVLTGDEIDGAPQSVEAGFIVEVTHSESGPQPRYLASVAGTVRKFSESRQGAVVMDFMSAMDAACRVESDHAGLARLVPVEMTSSIKD